MSPPKDSTPMERALALRQKRGGGDETLLDLLQKNKQALTRRLKGDAREADRLIAVAYDAVSRNHQLLKCDPASIVLSVRKAAELQLDLSPALGHCALVPRWSGKSKRMECSLEIMYHGLVELAYRSGKVAAVWASVVYNCDEFIHEDGLQRKLVHRPAAERPNDAELIATYAVAEMVAGGKAAVVLYRQDVEQRRESSPSWQARQAGKLKECTWDTHPGAMWRKSAIRALARDLPQSVAPQLQQAAAAEEADEAGLSVGAEMDLETPIPVEAEVVDPETGEVSEPPDREPGQEG